MPKPMNDTDHSYSLVQAAGVDRSNFGRYIGKDKLVAAKKAIKQVFRLLPSSSTVFIKLRESTRWSPPNSIVYFYKGTRERHVENKTVSSTKNIVQLYKYEAGEIGEAEFTSKVATATKLTKTN